MPIVQMPRGVTPVQIEIDKDVKKRTVKGAIHLTPGCTKVITDEELACIKKKEPKVASKLHVVPIAKKAEKEKTEPAKAEPESAPESAPATSKKTTKKSTKPPATNAE